MPRRLTKKTHYICLPEKRIREIKNLVASWPFETKEFMRARLNQYKPQSGIFYSLVAGFRWFLFVSRKRDLKILKNPEILTDWQKRFEVSGHGI